jgi:ADP-heptose:LPS heptosyltransferase
MPGGKSELKPLLYPFHQYYPNKLWSKYRWYLNRRLRFILPFLNKRKKWLTVIDRLGAPGDAIITANVIRCIKKKYENLFINCITPNLDLLKYDPQIDSLNQTETFYSVDSSYWELIVRKEKEQNIIEHNLQRLGINDYEYKASFFLNDEETRWATKQLDHVNMPRIAICTLSKEPVKNWQKENWAKLIKILSRKFAIIHLGDDKEPLFDDVIRYAGNLSMRESAAILSQTNHFIGPDSLLMHIANGLNIKSTIIFGGSRPVNCFGYADNLNLSTTIECSPCWIHHGYDECQHNLKCFDPITVSHVLKSFNSSITTNS